MTMDIHMIRSLWGMEAVPSLEEKLRRVRDAGYEGIECSQPDVEPAHWSDLMAEYGLVYVAMIQADTADEFEQAVRAIIPYCPVEITAQSGRDWMPFRDGCAFFLRALRTEREGGIPVAHETHRGRLFYAPWVTIQYLEEFPELKLCADFSHWCVVCESLLESLNGLMTLACDRSLRIHARVGYEQGPQVPDPRLPDYARHLARHERWWDEIRSCRMGNGAQRLTVTPEFGPPPYMQSHPQTRQPAVELDEICDWMAQRLRMRWG